MQAHLPTIDIAAIHAGYDHTLGMEENVIAVEPSLDAYPYEYIGSLELAAGDAKIQVEFVTAQGFMDGVMLVAFPSMRKVQAFRDFDAFVQRMIDLGFSVTMPNAGIDYTHYFPTLEERSLRCLRWEIQA